MNKHTVNAGTKTDQANGPENELGKRATTACRAGKSFFRRSPSSDFKEPKDDHGKMWKASLLGGKRAEAQTLSHEAAWRDPGTDEANVGTWVRVK